MVALAVMAMVAMVASQSFYTASVSSGATRDAMDRLAKIERTFVLMENDLRNALPKIVKPSFGQPLPPVYISLSGSDYWMVLMRGGLANPLHLPRTEDVRVGYRYEEESIWRDTWHNPAQNEQYEARPRKLLEGVTSLTVRVLPRTATSLAAGPWHQDWPRPESGPSLLPLAVEVTVELEDLGEIVRLFSLLPGEGGTIAPSG